MLYVSASRVSRVESGTAENQMSGAREDTSWARTRRNLLQDSPWVQQYEWTRVSKGGTDHARYDGGLDR